MTYVSAVNLDEIKSGLLAPLDGIRECLLELLDFGGGHLLGLRVRVGEWNRGRGLDYPT